MQARTVRAAVVEPFRNHRRGHMAGKQSRFRCPEGHNIDDREAVRENSRQNCGCNRQSNAFQRLQFAECPFRISMLIYRVYSGSQNAGYGLWPAPGSEDTDLGVLMEPEVGHGETEVYPRVQA